MAIARYWRCALSWLAVGLGATLGAWLRWGLGVWLNMSSASVQIGTLVANLSGGYLIGIAIAFFSSHPNIPPEWRLFAVTGFLGGLTTFSTFSAEAVILMQRGDYVWAFSHSALHLLGSIGFCIAGFASYRAFAG